MSSPNKNVEKTGSERRSIGGIFSKTNSQISAILNGRGEQEEVEQNTRELPLESSDSEASMMIDESPEPPRRTVNKVAATTDSTMSAAEAQKILTEAFRKLLIMGDRSFLTALSSTEASNSTTSSSAIKSKKYWTDICNRATEIQVDSIRTSPVTDQTTIAEKDVMKAGEKPVTRVSKQTTTVPVVTSEKSVQNSTTSVEKFVQAVSLPEIKEKEVQCVAVTNEQQSQCEIPELVDRDVQWEDMSATEPVEKQSNQLEKNLTTEVDILDPKVVSAIMLGIKLRSIVPESLFSINHIPRPMMLLPEVANSIPSATHVPFPSTTTMLSITPSAADSPVVQNTNISSQHQMGAIPRTVSQVLASLAATTDGHPPVPHTVSNQTTIPEENAQNVSTPSTDSSPVPGPSDTGSSTNPNRNILSGHNHTPVQFPNAAQSQTLVSPLFANGFNGLLTPANFPISPNYGYPQYPSAAPNNPLGVIPFGSMDAQLHHLRMLSQFHPYFNMNQFPNPMMNMFPPFVNSSMSSAPIVSEPSDARPTFGVPLSQNQQGSSSSKNPVIVDQQIEEEILDVGDTVRPASNVDRTSSSTLTSVPSMVPTPVLAAKADPIAAQVDATTRVKSTASTKRKYSTDPSTRKQKKRITSSQDSDESSGDESVFVMGKNIPQSSGRKGRPPKNSVHRDDAKNSEHDPDFVIGRKPSTSTPRSVSTASGSRQRKRRPSPVDEEVFGDEVDVNNNNNCQPKKKTRKSADRTSSRSSGQRESPQPTTSHPSPTRETSRRSRKPGALQQQLQSNLLNTAPANAIRKKRNYLARYGS